ncbi:hypothetical protein OZX72_05410 [Bifidobacterium sp. ESL0769]|uniref:hypothetical protein n=1 Tax=Bifidobacterium sp. ESL0769 TaxID=2983229 RepID=UPI0023F7E711|nr:hypothetical protein [Bifidobacterium sp. ESL0769]WEV66711.1 hypothetical protein OZX72_05410 [Bifidobacterium sp. ESL0769]
MMAFGNQNGEFDDVPKQIPYSATVENVENDVAVEPPQTDLEEAPSADIPANKTNENKRFLGIFKRRTQKQKTESDSRWSIAYLALIIIFQLVMASIALSVIGGLIRRNLQDPAVVWWGYYTSVVELAALAEYVASPIGLLVFLWVNESVQAEVESGDMAVDASSGGAWHRRHGGLAVYHQAA